MRKVLLIVAMLVLVVVGIGAKPLEVDKSVVLQATEDAYVVSDVAATDDPEGLRDQNFGTLDFIKTWYAWAVQQNEEQQVIGQQQVISIGLVKFDLTSLKDEDVKSATLQLYAVRADLTQAARLVDVNLVNADATWSENEVTFTNRPAWGTNPVAVAAVYGGGGWYSWDVSGTVLSQMKAGEVSFAMGLRSMDKNSEEQVVFASHEAAANAPRLIVTYQESSGGDSGTPGWVWPVVGGAVVIALIVGFLLSRRVSRKHLHLTGA